MSDNARCDDCPKAFWHKGSSCTYVIDFISYTYDNLEQERIYLVKVTGRVISAHTYDKLIKSFRFKAIEK